MTLAIAAVFGLVFGSFLNVVVHRVPRKMSLSNPPSTCPSCGVRIRPADNIPVASYVLLRGRCRNCRARISPRYPLTELASAALAVGAVSRFGGDEPAAFVAAGGLVLVALALIDLEHRRVPNVIVLPSTAVAAVWILGVSASEHRWGVARDAFASGAAGFALLFLIALVSGGMGFGDVKLAAFIGLYAGRFGWEVSVLALFAGFVIGGVTALALLVTRRRGRKDALPFAPSLAAGALIAVFWGSAPVRAWLGL